MADPRTQTPGSAAAASDSERKPLGPAVAAFAACWADFTKAFAIYPLSNTRVQQALDRLMESLPSAFAEVEVDPDIGLQVLFTRQAVRIAKGEEPLSRAPQLRWLDERVRRSALAGVAFLPNVTRKAVGDFTDRLLGSFSRDDLDLPFEELWPEDYEGLLLIDRRFEGFFDDTTAARYLRPATWGEDGEGPGYGKGNREIARLLAEDESVCEQLGRLQQEVREKNPGDNGAAWRRIDILPRIIQLLPHDALQHYDQAVLVTIRVMESLADRLAQAEGGSGMGAFADDTTLNQLIYATSRGIFGRRAPTAEEIAERLEKGKDFRELPKEKGIRSGRASDARVEDRVDLLLQELIDLPAPFDGELTPDNAESHDEQLGVYLHVLVRLDEETQSDGLRAHIADLLESAGDRRLNTLKEYLESTSDTGDPGYRRLIDLMCERGLQRVLRTSGYLPPERIARGFPRYFGLYLEALDPANAEDLDELDGVCTQVGSHRIRSARSDLLHQEGILEPHRVAPLIARASFPALPLLRLVISAGDNEQRLAAVNVLRKLRLDMREACLLYIWEDPVGLPLEYLLTLADPDRTEADLRAMHPKISHQICRFLTSPAGERAAEARRIYAINHLGLFGGREAEFVLRSLVRAKRLRLLPREPKAIREAAQNALKAMMIGRPRYHV